MLGIPYAQRTFASVCVGVCAHGEGRVCFGFAEGCEGIIWVVKGDEKPSFQQSRPVIFRHHPDLSHPRTRTYDLFCADHRQTVQADQRLNRHSPLECVVIDANEKGADTPYPHLAERY